MAGSVASHRRKFSIADARARRLGSAPAQDQRYAAVRQPELYARGMLQNGRTSEISAQTRDLILQNRSARLSLIAQAEKLIFN
jgi:hypothetical protein